MVKFKPGMMEQAVQLIDEHFAKAGMASTPGPQMMQFKTGDWDMKFIWSMDDITDMNWEVHSEDEKRVGSNG